MPPQRSRIEDLNALSPHYFRTKFWPFNLTHVGPNDSHRVLELYTSSTISSRDFNECFDLIHKTSSKQYAASSLGWHPQKKKQEMRLPDLKYVLAQKGDNSPENPIDGFLSFMLTYEDGIDVIYCYELHIAEHCQGSGLGKYLMGQMEDVGRKAGVKKAMLTVFRANEQARGFYAKLGYEVDDYSPRPKRLRGGIVKEADYIILSKPLIQMQDLGNLEDDESSVNEGEKSDSAGDEISYMRKRAQTYRGQVEKRARERWIELMPEMILHSDLARRGLEKSILKSDKEVATPKSELA